MELKTILAAYAGGQLEIQNGNEGYLFRGEIESATVEDGEVRVRFAWVAKNDGTPHQPSTEWTADPQLDYCASLSIYSFSAIGGGRICMNSLIVGETAVFYPKGYTNQDGEESKLDRSRIKGRKTI